MSRHRFEEYRILMYMEDPADSGCCATLGEIPNVLSDGTDPTDCVEGLRTSFELWVEEMEREGRPIPEPWGLERFSGRFLLRMPTGLHGRLADEAERQGVSINQYISTTLSAAVGFAEGYRAGADVAPEASLVAREG